MKSTLIFLKKHIKKLLILLIILMLSIPAIPQFFYKNKGESKSIGKEGSGKLENAYLLPRKGSNFSYFSCFSYYTLGDAYVHSKLYHTLMGSYAELEKIYPDQHFTIMECSRKKGGKMLIHRTHQNGLSVDFMTPLQKNNKQYRLYDHTGLFHYLFDFDEKGYAHLNNEVRIDFEKIAQHILILDDFARKNGLRIKKVIFKIELKDELFQTYTGKALKKRGIYFAQSLTPTINELHDDHYHVDFELQ